MTEQPPAASPTDASHLDLDSLADALAGEARPDAASHLAGCASCTSRMAELAAADARVSAVLSALPPPPVPDDLAARLSAALSDEPPLVAARASSSTVTPLPTRAPRRSWLPAAAAAVLLVSGGGLGYALITAPGGGDADTIAAGAADDGVPRSESGTDYADPAAVDLALPGVLSGTADDPRYSRQSAPEPAARTEGEGEGEDQLDSTAGGGSAAEPAEDSALTTMAAGDALDRLRTPDGLADCLAALLPPDEPDVRPLALDYARYSGSPALAVVLPDPDPAKLSVFVVGPGCSQADDSLLHFFRVDAP